MLADARLSRGVEVALADLASLRGWYPVAIDSVTEPPHLVWRYLGDKPLSPAFFEDSFSGQVPADRRVCRSALGAPVSSSPQLPHALPPNAFIFHVSRCGSTLLNQMLASLPGCVIASEPTVLDPFFRLHQHQHQSAISGSAGTLRQLVAALGQQRSPADRHFFVKLDSWHMPWLPWLRQLYPHTPCVLLYRQPEEVLASHRRQKGAHMVPGGVDLSALALSGASPAPADLDGHAARVLAGIFASALAAAQADVHTDANGPPITLVNYTQLPGVVSADWLAALGLYVDDAALALLLASTQQHAKHPSKRFEGDPPAVKPMIEATSASDASQQGLAQARAAYAALEALRLARQAGSV